MLFNKATLVVETCKQVFARDEHVVGFVHGGNAPELSCFDAVEFAAVPTETVVGVDGVEQIVAAVAAVHVTDHSVLPDKSLWVDSRVRESLTTRQQLLRYYIIIIPQLCSNTRTIINFFQQRI
jgi:hypothetical protein